MISVTVKVSPKFQVVIPEAIRNALGIIAGSHVNVIAKGKIAYLVPVPELHDLQKQLKGKISSDKIRDKRDRKL